MLLMHLFKDHQDTVLLSYLMGHVICCNEPFDVPFLSHGKLGLQKRQGYPLIPHTQQGETNGNTSKPQKS